LDQQSPTGSTQLQFQSHTEEVRLRRKERKDQRVKEISALLKEISALIRLKLGAMGVKVDVIDRQQDVNQQELPPQPPHQPLFLASFPRDADRDEDHSHGQPVRQHGEQERQPEGPNSLINYPKSPKPPKPPKKPVASMEQLVARMLFRRHERSRQRLTYSSSSLLKSYHKSSLSQSTLRSDDLDESTDMCMGMNGVIVDEVDGHERVRGGFRGGQDHNSSDFSHWNRTLDAAPSLAAS